ncbi:helix-turn-helix domain-containing protein [Treponema sp. R80B11-R83G3]
METKRGKYADDMIAERTGLSRRGLEQLRQRFVEEGFEVTLAGKPRGHRPKKLGGEDEARLIALTCSEKPEGRTRWTLRLLRDTWSALAHTDVKTVSHETIRRTLKKRNQAVAKPGMVHPAEPGKSARYDTEYKRNGTCEIFMFSAPLEKWRR